MQIQIRVLAVSLLLMAVVLMAGCPSRESIARIDQAPGRFAGREISIAGHVVTLSAQWAPGYSNWTMVLAASGYSAKTLACPDATQNWRLLDGSKKDSASEGNTTR